MKRRTGYSAEEHELLALALRGDIAAFEDLTKMHIRSSSACLRQLLENGSNASGHDLPLFVRPQTFRPRTRK